MRKISFKQKIILIIFGFVLSMSIIEIILRLGGFIFLYLQEYRNREALEQERAYRIVCLGESTTALGGRDSYPSQLQDILNQQNIDIQFSVINKGIPGIDTGVALSQLEDYIDKYKPNMVIAMMGINDGFGIIAYKESPKIILFLRSLRIYKLLCLFRSHIMHKVIKTDMNAVVNSSKFESKMSIFEEDQKMKNGNYELYFRLAWYHRTQERFDEAEKALKKAIEVDPKGYMAYYGLALCYIDRKDYDKATEILRKAIGINPENYRNYLELAWCYILKKEYINAKNILKEAIKINPLNDRAYIILAHCYKNLNNYKLARLYLDEANKLRSEYYNPNTRYNYQKVRDILVRRGIKFVCVQYPMRSIKPLKKMFNDTEGIIFVDNERIFKAAVKESSYDDYFKNIFGGDFGHGTRKGNRLLAENIAKIILKKCFDIPFESE